jgi:hypothetical protein
MTRALVMSDYADPDTEIERLSAAAEAARVLDAVMDRGPVRMPLGGLTAANNLRSALAALEGKPRG